MTGGRELLAYLVVYAQVDEVGRQQTPQQELGREVIEPALAGVGGHLRRLLTHKAFQQAQHLGIRELGKLFAKGFARTNIKVDHTVSLR